MKLRVCLMMGILFSILAVVSANVSAMTIAQAKMSPNGTQMELTARSVSFAQTDLFYVEEADRSCGLLVVKPGHGFVAGFKVDVTGVMQTNPDGEKYIDVQTATRAGTEFVQIKPLLVNCKSVGGGDWHYDPNTEAGQMGTARVGLNNVGLLVRIAAAVIYADRNNGIAYIDDGSALSDGNTLGPSASAVRGVRVVILPQGVSMPQAGRNIEITGVVGTKRINGVVMPCLRPASYTGEMQPVDPGTFLIGNTQTGDDWTALQGDMNQYTNDELPQHEVTLTQGYWLGKYEVTRGEYRQFVNAGGYNNAYYWSADGWAWKMSLNKTEPLHWASLANWGTPPGPFVQTEWHPVCGVSYYEAEAFCKWAGCRLPTEAEWEKAARWDGTPRIFPWGNVWNNNYCNQYSDTIYSRYQTAPVGSYSQNVSPVGCYDMAGNLWEWCKDWCPRAPYELPSGPVIDPQGPNSGTARCLRGGSWLYGNTDARCASRYRMSPGSTLDYLYNIGFRTAR